MALALGVLLCTLCLGVLLCTLCLGVLLCTLCLGEFAVHTVPRLCWQQAACSNRQVHLSVLAM